MSEAQLCAVISCRYAEIFYPSPLGGAGQKLWQLEEPAWQPPLVINCFIQISYCGMENKRNHYRVSTLNH